MECTGCNKTITKAHSYDHQRRPFCQRCYYHDFEKAMCTECGNGIKLYKGLGDGVCKTCKIKGRTCSSCQKPLPKAAKTIGNDAYCWPCSQQFRPLETCSHCGEKRHALSKAPKFGVYERICQQCRNKLTLHITCPSCGKYREPAGSSANGSIVCKRCLDEPVFTCPTCNEKGKRHSKSECDKCYWTSRAQAKIAKGVSSLTQSWTRHAFRQFGQHQIKQLSGNSAAIKMDRYISFFRKLDQGFTDPKLITNHDLLDVFQQEGLRRYRNAVNFLVTEGIIKAIDENKINELSVFSRIDSIITNYQKGWYGETLNDFSDYALNHHQLAMDRGHQTPTLRTVLSWVQSAAAFLHFIEGKNKKDKILARVNQTDLDDFTLNYPGYASSVSTFVSYLNFEKNLFDRIDLKTLPKKNDIHYLLSYEKYQALSTYFFASTTPTKEALIGVLMLFYAQKAKSISELQLNQIAKKGDKWVLKFTDVDTELPSKVSRIIDKWLTIRKKQLSGKPSNQFLFPGAKVRAGLSESSIAYYVNKWGVRARQLRATAVSMIFVHGVRHPNVPAQLLGVSKAMAGHYLAQLNTHANDAIQYMQNND